MLRVGKGLKIKIVLTIFSFFAFSQNIKAEQNDAAIMEKLKKMLQEQGDGEKKISYSKKPSALNIGIDIFTPAYSYFQYGTSFHNYFLHSNIDFNRIFLDVDFGVLRYHKKQPFILPEKYQSHKDGDSKPTTYDDSAFNINGKVGLSYNFLHKNVDHNAIFAGFGYNIAFCKDKLSGKLAGTNLYSNGFETETQNFLVQWCDVVLGLRLSISKMFYIGHTTHFNIFKYFLIGKNNSIIPYYISGYGPEENSFNLKFDFYIGLNIPLYDDPKFDTKR